MFSSRGYIENDFCPVRGGLLGEMYRANENGLPQLVEAVSSRRAGDAGAVLLLPPQPSALSLALSIAASCSEGAN